jgi:hypothetical protein
MFDETLQGVHHLWIRRHSNSSNRYRGPRSADRNDRRQYFRDRHSGAEVPAMTKEHSVREVTRILIEGAQSDTVGLGSALGCQATHGVCISG